MERAEAAAEEMRKAKVKCDGVEGVSMVDCVKWNVNIAGLQASNIMVCKKGMAQVFMAGENWCRGKAVAERQFRNNKQPWILSGSL
jgi:hypothetical protein